MVYNMNKREKEILKVVLNDIMTLDMDLSEDFSDNAYYLKLIKGNIKDLIGGKYGKTRNN